MTAEAAAQRIAAEFEYTDEDVRKSVNEFLKEMDEGLAKDGTAMSQIPTYVTGVPNGTEKGLYMAVDLGGTNFRVCSIQLHGNTTFSLTQSKVAIPKELMVAQTAKELFSFLAQKIEVFLKTHHNDKFLSHMERRGSLEKGYSDLEVFYLGFTFSFPVQQYGINRGHLIRWTKGFDIDDAIGKDVCKLLQDEIDALNLPVKVAALVNDTVGTLLARSYTSPGKTGTLLGAIFGTGTNGAYVEKLSRVTKLKDNPEAEYDESTGEMIVNTEWGSFDLKLAVLPTTSYDRAVDADSNNPGVHLFEKRVSGMYLGEILRRALLDLIADKSSSLFSDSNSGLNDLHSTTVIGDDSPLYRQYGLDTSFLSTTHGDTSPSLQLTRQALERDLDVNAVSHDSAAAVQLVARAVGKRAARLAGMAIAATILQSGRLTAGGAAATDAPTEDNIVDIGVDGSLVEFYPGFEAYAREAMRAVPQIGEAGEKRVRIGIAKDGSGVGAALIALMAEKMGKRRVSGQAA